MVLLLLFRHSQSDGRNPEFSEWDSTSCPLRPGSGTHLSVRRLLTDGWWKLEPGERCQREAGPKVTAPQTKMAVAAGSRGRKWDTSARLNKTWKRDQKGRGRERWSSDVWSLFNSTLPPSFTLVHRSNPSITWTQTARIKERKVDK